MPGGYLSDLPELEDEEDDKRESAGSYLADLPELEAAPPRAAVEEWGEPNVRMAPTEIQGEAPAWYEPLLEKGASFLEGLTKGGNFSLHGPVDVNDPSTGSKIREQRALMQENAARNPLSRLAGEMVGDVGASLAAPAGFTGQAAAGALSSGASEMGRSGDLGKAAVASGAGGLVSGTLGAFGKALTGPAAQDAALKRALTRGDPAAEAAVSRVLGYKSTRGQTSEGMQAVMQRARELSPRNLSPDQLQRAASSSSSDAAQALDDLFRRAPQQVPSDPTMVVRDLRIPRPADTVVSRAPKMPRYPDTVVSRAPKPSGDATVVDLPPRPMAPEQTVADYVLPQETKMASYKASAPRAASPRAPGAEWKRYEGLLDKAAADPVAAGWSSGSGDLAGRVAALRHGLSANSPEAEKLLQQHAIDSLLSGMSTGAPKSLMDAVLSGSGVRLSGNGISMSGNGLTGAAMRGIQYGAQKAALSPWAGPLHQGVAGAGGAAAGALGGALAPEGLVDQPASAGAPAVNWSLQSVLSSGNSGLPPESEQELTESVLRGDMDETSSIMHRLQMKYPAFQARVERELRSLHEGSP